ncbi:MAG TPA: bifunctional adenosylcobinamide kinase/adenosylcobinamide-phosphate guanylyltransferase [Jiangellaceae bacterium]|nr:bifunctional adenosylcobinamide kinase/adenosylcobinamide-phosphate guanylyltransferase [Jiangellaceae bacterium]
MSETAMEIVLLGTGSADGWPNAFCRCASCRTHAATDLIRTPTSALVDDTLLLDCGPETPRAALRAGHRLDRLAGILLTHGHPDHSAPMAMLARTWARRTEPIVVAGPAAVLEQWKPWVDPDDPVRWQPVTAGDDVHLAGYTIHALPAAHDQPAVLYLVESPDGHRVLYATDTGPLPSPAVTAATQQPVDVLLLEETFGDHTEHGTAHLDLPAFGRELARLRAEHALRPGCEVVAVHLSHHNPPSPELDRRLATWGARPGHDGEHLITGVRNCARHGVHSHAQCGCSSVTARTHRTLVLGGARSGKSRTAEQLLGSEPEVVYIATGQPADGTDPEWDERVRQHRERRPPGWTTVEAPDASAALRSADAPVLLDCLGTWLTGVLTETGAWADAAGWQERAQHRVDDLLAAIRDCTVPVVLVSNEVGSGVVPAHPAGILFRDWLGRLNQAVARHSERVLLMVAGRAVELS